MPTSGFVIADNVLDKKRLRTIYASVGGLFATLVPVMISFNTGAGEALTYAAFPHSSTVYAYNSLTRSYEDSLAYCESLWMFPATLDPSVISEEDIQSIMDVMVGLGNSAFAGAVKNEAGHYEWSDGTPWTRRPDDIDASPDEKWLYLKLSGGVGDPPSWRDTNGAPPVPVPLPVPIPVRTCACTCTCRIQMYCETCVDARATACVTTSRLPVCCGFSRRCERSALPRGDLEYPGRDTDDTQLEAERTAAAAGV